AREKSRATRPYSADGHWPGSGGTRPSTANPEDSGSPASGSELTAPAAVTLGSVAALSTSCAKNVDQLGPSRLKSKVAPIGNEMLAVNARSGTKPGLTRWSLTKLDASRPAATSNTSERAILATTSRRSHDVRATHP